MLRLIRGAKLWTRVLAREQRPQLLKIERQLKEVVELVDSFYALLGPRNWIFHEHLSTEKVTAILRLPVGEAERGLVEIYKDPDTLGFLIRMLGRFPELRARRDLIDRARTDYAEGRYYSTALVLLTVMDGFVNDFEPKHRGLHTRSEGEMNAWDSIVGHHLGLANAHRTFTKSFSKFSDEEIYELYRNGILHGNLVNYDNDVVASKAWNRLFAVADWATSRQKQAIPPKPEPAFRELISKIAENERAKKALEEWRRRAVTEEQPGFIDEPLYRRASEYLAAWQLRNYGSMAELLSSLVRQGTSGETARMIREGCTGFDLSDYSIHRLDFQAAAVCEVDVDLVFGTEVKPALLRWIREGGDGMAALPNQSGEWRLGTYAPLAMINRARSE